MSRDATRRGARRSVLAAVLLASAAQGGCAGIDPLTSARDWHPTGANDANLLAMVVDPADLLNGAPAPLADGAVASAAIARYRAGKVAKLPDSGVAQIVPVPSGAASPPASAASE